MRHRGSIQPGLLASLLLAACSDGAGSTVADGSMDAIGGIDELRIGTIDLRGDSNGVLGAPASAMTGVAFSVRVTTYGGGCQSGLRTAFDVEPVAIDQDTSTTVE